MASVELATAFVQIIPSGKGLEAGVAKEMGVAGAAGGQVGGVAFGSAFTKASKAGALAGAAAFGKGLVDFSGFEAQMNEVFTLLPDLTGKAYGKMTEDTKKFAAETGTRLAEVPTPLYDALSAGVPPDNVFDFLRDANKFAKAGATDLGTAVDGLTTVINAFGLEAEDAGMVSDSLFTAVKLGKTTVEELSASLFQVAPVASTFGVSLDDVSSSLATLTAQGVPTSVATTQVRSAIAELGKEGTKASKTFEDLTGKSFTQFIAEGGSLAEVAGIMAEGAKEADISIVDMFGSIEAGSALAALASDLDTTESNLEAVQNAAGATDKAFDQMEKGLKPTFDKIRARIDVVFVELGSAFAPVVAVIGGGIATLLELFTSLPGPIQTGALAILTIAAAGIGFATALGKVVTAAKGLSSALTALSVNPWVLVGLAIVVIAYLIYRNWSSITEFLSNTWEWISTTATNIWNSILTFFQEWWPLLLAAFFGPLGLLVYTVVTHWDTIKAFTIEIWNTIASWIGDRIDSIVGFFSGLVDRGQGVVNFFAGLPAALGGIWDGIVASISSAVDRIVAKFRQLKQEAYDVINSMPGGFLVTGGMDLVGGLFFDQGGVVPGPKGAARLAVVHAGETVLPTHKMPLAAALPAVVGSSGGSRSASVSGLGGGPLIGTAYLASDMDIERTARELARRFDRELAAQGRRNP